MKGLVKEPPLPPQKAIRKVSNVRPRRDKVGSRVGSQQQTAFNGSPDTFSHTCSDMYGCSEASLPAQFKNSIDFTTPTQLPGHLEEDSREITPPSHHLAPPPLHSVQFENSLQVAEPPGCYDDSHDSATHPQQFTAPSQGLGSLEDNSSSDTFLSHVKHTKGNTSFNERGRLITPLSRHSSGFGSLQDEGSSVTLESADIRHTPLSALPPKQRPHLRERKRNEITTGRFSKESVGSSQEDLSSRDTRRQAWTSSVPTPLTSALTSAPDSVPTPLTSAPGSVPTPLTSVPTPLASAPTWASPAPAASVHREGEVQGAQALMEKHVTLHQSKLERQRLAKDVQLLNLKVMQKQIV